VAEYAVMRAGVGGLSLTYGDTLGDLVLSTTGGAIGAWAALHWLTGRADLDPPTTNLQSVPAHPGGN
jgi:hypothetical protein